MTSPISSRSSVTHQCPGGCGRSIPSGHFACHTDWLRLPYDLRKPISQHFRRDAEAHFAAMSNAMAWYRANKRPSTPDVTA